MLRFELLKNVSVRPRLEKRQMLKIKLLIIKRHSFILSSSEKFPKSNSISVLREI